MTTARIHALAAVSGIALGTGIGLVLGNLLLPSTGVSYGELPMEEQEREAWVLRRVQEGAVPPFLLSFVPVPVSDGRGHRGTIFVSPDYLGVGSDGNYLRTPLSAPGAQRAVSLLSGILPTKKMVEDIEREASRVDGIVAFSPFSPQRGESRNSKRLWEASNAAIEARRLPSKPLYAGHKKDVIVGPEIARNPGKVIIFGGLWSDRKRVQPPSGVHTASYRDYSHGVRLVRSTMLVEGAERPIAEVAADPAFWGLVLTEGPSSRLSYSS